MTAGGLEKSMAMIDEDGIDALTAAMVRLWIAEQPHEIPVVADWLGCDEDVLLAGLGLSEVPPPPPPPAPKPAATCEQCGGPLPVARTGPQRRFCDRCRAVRRDEASLRSKQRFGSRTRRRA